jgi:UPF0716 family protein affecting phage T7 exclusion
MLSFVAGMMLLRRQGLGILRKMSTQGRTGALPGRELLRPAMFVIAAILLIIPGFISDIIALLIFIPAVRDLAWNYVSRRFVVGGRPAPEGRSNRLSAMPTRRWSISTRRIISATLRTSLHGREKASASEPTGGALSGWLRVVTTSSK